MSGSSDIKTYYSAIRPLSFLSMVLSSPKYNEILLLIYFNFHIINIYPYTYTHTNNVIVRRFTWYLLQCLTFLEVKTFLKRLR